MPADDRTQPLLPHAAPLAPGRRLLLFAIRRMATAGLRDAFAAHALFTAFGLSYRRPLLLIRAMMAELSAVSRRSIAVAPCCCPRMTADEGMLIGLVTGEEPQTIACDRLLGRRGGSSVASAADAIALAFADCGLPLAEGATPVR